MHLLVLNKYTKYFLQKKVYRILSKKDMKLMRCIFLVLNKCIKYFLQKKCVQNIVKYIYIYNRRHHNLIIDMLLLSAES